MLSGAIRPEHEVLVQGVYGESWQFFISTRAPARKQDSDVITAQVLKLVECEPLDAERGARVPHRRVYGGGAFRLTSECVNGVAQCASEDGPDRR